MHCPGLCRLCVAQQRDLCYSIEARTCESFQRPQQGRLGCVLVTNTIPPFSFNGWLSQAMACVHRALPASLQVWFDPFLPGQLRYLVPAVPRRDFLDCGLEQYVSYRVGGMEDLDH